MVEPGSVAGQSPVVHSIRLSPSPGPRRFGSFVALGDSFSEGVGDPGADGETVRGWADRLAEQLDGQAPGLRYANLAIRGKMLGQVVSEQVPAAVSMRADLVSIAAGGNDLLRPRADPDALAGPFSGAVAALTAAGSTVLIVAGFDPGMFPLIRIIRRRAAVFNSHLRIIARQHGCLLVDLWGMSVLSDRRMWCEDRLHLGPEGHQRVALRAAEVLGVPAGAAWREPLPSERDLPRSWLDARRQDAAWAREHALPWVRRRMAGVSSGDGMTPKRPDLLPL